MSRPGSDRSRLTAPVLTLPAMTRPVPEHKVTLCHGTSGIHPYIEIEVDVAAVLRQGHDQHTHEDRHDIIPPFMFIGRDGLVIFPGLGDQSVLANHCLPPGDDGEPTTTTSTTSTSTSTTSTTTTSTSTTSTSTTTTTTCPDCTPNTQVGPTSTTTPVTTTTVVITQLTVPGGSTTTSPSTSTTTTCPNCGTTTTTTGASFVAAPSGALPFTSQPASTPASGPLAFSGAEDSLLMGFGLSALLVGALVTRLRHRLYPGR